MQCCAPPRRDQRCAQVALQPSPVVPARGQSPRLWGSEQCCSLVSDVEVTGAGGLVPWEGGAEITVSLLTPLSILSGPCRAVLASLLCSYFLQKPYCFGSVAAGLGALAPSHRGREASDLAALGLGSPGDRAGVGGLSCSMQLLHGRAPAILSVETLVCPLDAWFQEMSLRKNCACTRVRVHAHTHTLTRSFARPTMWLREEAPERNPRGC